MFFQAYSLFFSSLCNNVSHRRGGCVSDLVHQVEIRLSFVLPTFDQYIEGCCFSALIIFVCSACFFRVSMLPSSHPECLYTFIHCLFVALCVRKPFLIFCCCPIVSLENFQVLWASWPLFCNFQRLWIYIGGF